MLNFDLQVVSGEQDDDGNRSDSHRNEYHRHVCTFYIFCEMDFKEMKLNFTFFLGEFCGRKGDLEVMMSGDQVDHSL